MVVIINNDKDNGDNKHHQYHKISTTILSIILILVAIMSCIYYNVIFLHENAVDVQHLQKHEHEQKVNRSIVSRKTKQEIMTVSAIMPTYEARSPYLSYAIEQFFQNQHL